MGSRPPSDCRVNGTVFDGAGSDALVVAQHACGAFPLSLSMAVLTSFVAIILSLRTPAVSLAVDWWQVQKPRLNSQ